MKQGTNAAIMRKRNEKTILSLINNGPISRAEIAKITGLTRAAVTIIIDDLIGQGYILEAPTMQATVGRQPILLSFNGKSVYAVGINIRRTSFCVGISDLNGNVIIEEQFPILPPEEFFGGIREIVERQIAEADISRERIYGVGVATPGPIDVQKGRILNPPNFKQWHNVAVADKLRECLELPVYHENVANASALAEMYYGNARENRNFMTLLVDDGIGSGIVLNQQLFGGINELGHTSICFDGKLCECGNRGCLENYAAMPMFLEGTGYKSWKEVVDAKDVELIEREAAYLSAAITTANNLFDLDMLVLCGDICYCPEALKNKIYETVNSRRLRSKFLRISVGQVRSGLLIAAALVCHEFFN